MSLIHSATGDQLSVLGAVLNERQFQDEKYGPVRDSVTQVDGPGSHSVGEWILLLEAELNEAKLALIKGGSGRNSLRSELIQVIALGFAALEQHGLRDPHDRRQI